MNDSNKIPTGFTLTASGLLVPVTKQPLLGTDGRPLGVPVRSFVTRRGERGFFPLDALLARGHVLNHV